MNTYQQDPDQALSEARATMMARAEHLYRRSPGADPAHLVDMLDTAMRDIAADACLEAAARLMASARLVVDRAAATTGTEPADSPAAIGEAVGNLARLLVGRWPALVPEMVAERLAGSAELIGEGWLDEPGVPARAAAVLVAAASELLDMHCSAKEIVGS